MSAVYIQEIDRRFAPVVEQIIARADLVSGQNVLDLGTGTGSVALAAAPVVGPEGPILGIDISGQMLALAARRVAEAALTNVGFVMGSAEAIAAPDVSVDVVVACLSMMYVGDRAAAASECARVLRPGGRFVASVWAPAEECDIVLFQQTAASVAPAPTPGVGPGALADPKPFVAQLAEAGIDAAVERETLGFEFADFSSAWEALAGVTTAALDVGKQREAQAAVMAVLWPDGDGPRYFRNITQFIVGRRRAQAPAF